MIGGNTKTLGMAVMNTTGINACNAHVTRHVFAIYQYLPISSVGTINRIFDNQLNIVGAIAGISMCGESICRCIAITKIPVQNLGVFTNYGIELVLITTITQSVGRIDANFTQITWIRAVNRYVYTHGVFATIGVFYTPTKLKCAILCVGMLWM